jgi:Tfp pilus assembly protein PilF
LALLAESGVEELFAEAEEWLARAVVTDPENADARVFRAFLFNRLGRRDEASEELAAFDSLADQPADMLSLIDQFALRDVLAG